MLFFFKTGNARELAERIKDFQNGKYDAEGMSQLGKKIAKENYSKSAYLDKLLNIYQETIDNKVNA